MNDGEIFDVAKALVLGPREASYDHPFDNFSRIGRLWQVVLEGWAKDPTKPIPPELVGLCMLQVKVAREVYAPAEDNRVDIVGYGGTIQRVHERMEAK